MLAPLSLLNPFEKLAELLPEALALVSREGEILAVNLASCELFGQDLAGLVGRPLAQFCVEDGTAVSSMIRAGARTSRMLPSSLTIVRTDGTHVPCRCGTALYEPGHGGPSAIVLLRLVSKQAAVNRFTLLNERIDQLSNEIAKRRMVERELRDTTERLRVTLGSIGDAVIATDAKGAVTFMNPVAELLTGWTAERAGGRLLHEVFFIVQEDSGEQAESPVAKVLRCDGVVGLANHTALVRPDGTRLPIDDSAAPIRDAGGAIIGVVMVFHDVSERNAMERELVLRAQRLEEADKRKDEFLSMLAHELRNPLAPLAMGVELLAMQFADRDDTLRLVRMMGRQSRHMARLLDDLLDVSRVTRGTVALKREQLRLDEVLERAREMTLPALGKRAVTLEMGACHHDLYLDGDATRLVQVFANLLSNAAKFSKPGGVVQMQIHRESTHAVVTIRDHGIGIDSALLPKVFELFVQGERSLDRTEGGLGIGLTICRSILRMHGGEVTASSEGTDRGSEFVVSLPLLATIDEASASLISVDLSSSGRSLEVLIVDDNIDAAESLRSIVELWGHEVRTVYSARSALELVETLKPEAVLLDIGLPEMNGYDLARAIRQVQGMDAALLVAVTGYGDADARLSSIQAGCNHHLTKPADSETLRAVLEEHARRVAG